MSAPITLIGTGLAGYNLARELRKLLPDAAIRVVTADAGDFYSKPMLSNGLASNKTAAQLAMKPAAKMREELRLELLTDTEGTAIDRERHEIVTSRGRLPYSKLVLALGADPFAPCLAGSAAEQVLTVNDLADYAHFRQRLEGKRRIVLLGAGLIGCEFANDLVASGHEVSVVDLAAWPLSRLLPEAAGERLRDSLVAAGVRFYFGVIAQAVEGEEGAYRVSLSDGSVLEAELVVSAIGLRPRTRLAQEAGLSVSRGIVVDRLLRSSDPDIHALGDCAEVSGQVLPFVLPIMQAVRALAPTLAGTPTTVAYPAMPVVVKTPACPTVVSPPAVGSRGDWRIESSEAGLRALFMGEDGQLLGFALLGAATAERQALAPQLPAILA